jgi:hypothetical protein
VHVGIASCREAQPAADEDESSDEFPSDDEENGEEADVESGSEDAISDDLDRDFDNDGFIPDSFLWHLENDKTTTAFDPLQYSLSHLAYVCMR